MNDFPAHFDSFNEKRCDSVGNLTAVKLKDVGIASILLLAFVARCHKMPITIESSRG